jgi:acetyl-CoA acyltransferase
MSSPSASSACPGTDVLRVGCEGHPLAATGLAQAAELAWQLRGEAGARQVAGARAGLAHNSALGGAAVITLLRKS